MHDEVGIPAALLDELNHIWSGPNAGPTIPLLTDHI